MARNQKSSLVYETKLHHSAWIGLFGTTAVNPKSRSEHGTPFRSKHEAAKTNLHDDAATAGTCIRATGRTTNAPAKTTAPHDLPSCEKTKLKQPHYFSPTFPAPKRTLENTFITNWIDNTKTRITQPIIPHKEQLLKTVMKHCLPLATNTLIARAGIVRQYFLFLNRNKLNEDPFSLEHLLLFITSKQKTVKPTSLKTYISHIQTYATKHWPSTDVTPFKEITNYLSRKRQLQNRRQRILTPTQMNKLLYSTPLLVQLAARIALRTAQRMSDLHRLKTGMFYLSKTQTDGHSLILLDQADHTKTSASKGDQIRFRSLFILEPQMFYLLRTLIKSKPPNTALFSKQTLKQLTNTIPYRHALKTTTATILLNLITKKKVPLFAYPLVLKHKSRMEEKIPATSVRYAEFGQPRVTLLQTIQWDNIALQLFHSTQRPPYEMLPSE